MNGRRARAIRDEAARICADLGTAERPGYQPQTVRDRSGRITARYPEVRLMPGTRSLARKMRRSYVRNGRRAPVVVAPDGREVNGRG